MSADMNAQKDEQGARLASLVLVFVWRMMQTQQRLSSAKLINEAVATGSLAVCDSSYTGSPRTPCPRNSTAVGSP